jgi:hypothetical protein
MKKLGGWLWVREFTEPNKLNTVPEKTPLEEVLQALEEGFYGPSVFEIQVALADLGLEVADFQAFSKEVLREAGNRTSEVLRGFWKAIEVSPPREVEEALQKGLELSVFYSAHKKLPGEEPKVEIYLGKLGEKAEKAFYFPLPPHVRSEGFVLHAWGWWIGGGLHPGLFFQRGRAFFRGYGLRRVRRVLEGVKALSPLFVALGLSDLEGALEALGAMAELDYPQPQAHGHYVLVRNERFYGLRRGSIFRNPVLDADFLCEKRVEISTPKGVKIVLKPSFSQTGEVGLKEGFICWDGECEDLIISLPSIDVNHPRLLTRLVREGLHFALAFPTLSHSPKMRALLDEIGALGRRGDLLAALEDEEFFRRVHLRALAYH